MAARIDFSAPWERSRITRLHDLDHHPGGRRQRSILGPYDAANAAVAERHHQSHAAHMFAVLDLNSVRLDDAVAFDSRQGESPAARCLDVEIRNPRAQSTCEESSIRLHAGGPA